MRKLSYIIFAGLFFVSISLSAGDNPEKKSKITYQQIEKNLLVGLDSDNRGLQMSAAYFLGEIKSRKAVIPLLRMLHNGNTEGERIIAALSLYKINSELSIYAVKQAAKFDDSERVRRNCANFYNEYLAVKLGISEKIQTANANTTFFGYSLNDFYSIN